MFNFQASATVLGLMLAGMATVFVGNFAFEVFDKALRWRESVSIPLSILIAVGLPLAVLVGVLAP